MTITLEQYLIIGLYAFYLYDSLILLAPTECLITKSCGAWSIVVPSVHMEFGGKFIHLLNLFAPAALVFKANFSKNTTESIELESLNSLLIELKPIKYTVSVLVVILLVLMPILIVRYGTGVSFLCAALSSYMAIIALSAYIFLKRKCLNLSNRDVASIVFDSLACPPFAINALHRITIRQKFNFEIIGFSRAHLTEVQFSKFVEKLAFYIESQVQMQDESTTAGISLCELQKKLMEIKANDHN